MRWLLFLSRLALICGICFLLSLSLLFREWTKDQDIAATLITIGFIMGIVVVPLTLLCYMIIVASKRKLTSVVPLWLIIGNIFSLILLLLYIIFNNGQSNHPA